MYVQTRCNSTYLMLEHAMKFRVAFDKMEVEDKLYDDNISEYVDRNKRIGPLTKDDWDVVEMLVQFLIILYKPTLFFSYNFSLCS